MKKEAIVKLRLIDDHGIETFEEVDSACLCYYLTYDEEQVFYSRQNNIKVIELFVARDTGGNPCHVGLRQWSRTWRRPKIVNVDGEVVNRGSEKDDRTWGRNVFGRS